jgi:hypothetical protein
MRSSRTITLFTESQDTGQGPVSLAASVGFHCLAVALIAFGVLYAPRLNTKAIAERYNVRRLDLDMPDDPPQKSTKGKIDYPKLKPAKVDTSTGGRPTALRQVVHAPKGPQTLLQPDLPKQIALQELVPLPTLMVWSPSKTQAKTVVAPQPSKPTAANVTPSAAPPNLADVNMVTSPIEHPKLLALAATTSPVAVPGPEVELPPTNIAQVSAQPTPAALLSLSDIQMTKGAVVLPPANESADANSKGPLAAGAASDSKAPGNADHDGNGGNGKAQTNTSATAGDGGTNQEMPGNPNAITATKITLPREGQFGAVVVGASLGDEYPELNHVWGGRLAYTVYLHVGLARSWILQYSLPATDDVNATKGAPHLDAPWPFNIVRPNIANDAADAEAVMVHGFVNQAGRFEGLKIVYPPEYPQTEFVIASLQQWQFRPAARDGQLARVEVLLIIPEQMQ